MYFDNPELFEEYLSPIGGEVCIRPAVGSTFSAEINLHKLESIGLFSVSANSFKVLKKPQGLFFGLSIPLSAPLSVSERGRTKEFTQSTAHVLKPGDPFDVTGKSKPHFLVCNFFTEPTFSYAQKLLQTDNEIFTSPQTEVSFLTQSGSNLLRSIARSWAALNGKTNTNEIALKELEDNLMASFILHQNTDNKPSPPVVCDSNIHLHRAEEYICENLNKPITRDKLADISGRSIRTLSRAFEKKYGVGPMAFVKQRRLDATYLELLSAKSATTTVTEVAMNYGFEHVGKFAIEFRKAFGESPSTSLVRN